MKIVKILFFFSLLASFDLSSQTLYAESNLTVLKQELSSINTENPEQDFKKHVADKNYKFIGLYGGEGRYFPGIDKANYSLIEKHGAHMFDGTSDVIESEEYGELIKNAEAYAKTYNTALFQYLARHKNIPVAATKDPNHAFVKFLEEIELNYFKGKKHWRKGDFPAYTFVQCDIDKDRARLSYKKEGSGLEFYLAYFRKVGGLWYFDFNDVVFLAKKQNDGSATTLIHALKQRNSLYWFKSDKL